MSAPDPADEVAAYERTLARWLHDRAATAPDPHLPAALVDDLRDARRCDVPALREEISRRLARRKARGVGTLRDAFPDVFAAWAAQHPQDADAHRLIDAFAASDAFATWSAVGDARPGVCLEAAFGAFVGALGLVSSDDLAFTAAQAVGRALVIDPDPAFDVPPPFTGGPGRWIAVTPGPRLVAAVGRQLVAGPITPLLADLLRGASPADAATRRGTPLGVAHAARDGLIAKGLLVATPTPEGDETEQGQPAHAAGYAAP